MKTLKNHSEKMGVIVNIRMSKIMRMSIKAGVHTYVTYVHCQTLPS